MPRRKQKGRTNKKSAQASKPLKKEKTTRRGKPPTQPTHIASSDETLAVSAAVPSTSGVTKNSASNKIAPQTRSTTRNNQAALSASDLYDSACKDPKLHVANMDQQNPNDGNRAERRIRYDIVDDLRRVRAGYGLRSSRKGSDDLVAYCQKNTAKGKGRGKRPIHSSIEENKITKAIPAEDAVEAVHGDKSPGVISVTKNVVGIIDDTADNANKAPNNNQKSIKGKGIGKKSKPNQGTSNSNSSAYAVESVSNTSSKVVENPSSDNAPNIDEQDTTAQAVNNDAPIVSEICNVGTDYIQEVTDDALTTPEIFSVSDSIEDNGLEGILGDQQLTVSCFDSDSDQSTVESSNSDPDPFVYQGYQLYFGSNLNDPGSPIFPVQFAWSSESNGGLHVSFDAYYRSERSYCSVFLRGSRANAGRGTHHRYGNGMVLTASRSAPASFYRGMRARTSRRRQNHAAWEYNFYPSDDFYNFNI